MGISRHVGAVQHTGGHSGIPGGQLGRLIVLFNNISARQKPYLTANLTDSGVGGENGEPLWGYGPHPGHPPCVTYIY